MKNIALYPTDIYQVIDKSLLNENDKYVLNMLYMPIIGFSAIVLYLKLQSDTNNSYISSEYTHRHLMSSMSLTLDNIKESKKNKLLKPRITDFSHLNYSEKLQCERSDF